MVTPISVRQNWLDADQRAIRRDHRQCEPLDGAEEKRL